MQAFEFYCPTKIYFGKGAEARVGEAVKHFGGTKVFIVYGGHSAVKSGLIARIEQTLTDAGLEHMSFGGVQPNPRLSHAREDIGNTRVIRISAPPVRPENGVRIPGTVSKRCSGISGRTMRNWRTMPDIRLRTHSSISAEKKPLNGSSRTPRKNTRCVIHNTEAWLR